jgi:hypothetical protein
MIGYSGWDDGLMSAMSLLREGATSQSGIERPKSDGHHAIVKASFVA